MKEQDRHDDHRPSRPEGDIREPRIRRPHLDAEENVTAEREAFFQDFDLAARQQTGEPYYSEDQGYSGQGYASQGQGIADQDRGYAEQDRVFTDQSEGPSDRVEGYDPYTSPIPEDAIGTVQDYDRVDYDSYESESTTDPYRRSHPERSSGSVGQAEGYGQAEDYGRADYYSQTEDYGQAEGYGQAVGYGQADSYRHTGEFESQNASLRRDSYRRSDDYGQADAYSRDDVNRQVYTPRRSDAPLRQDSYESFDRYDYSNEDAEPTVYPGSANEEEAPWKRSQKEEKQAREPNPMVEKAQELAIDSLKGAVLWIRLFFSQDPRRAMSHALKGQEKFSFIPVLLILILIVPIQTLLAFQASAAGLNAQISAFQGLAPIVTPGVVYGSDLLRYVLEYVILTALFFGLLKLLQTDVTFEGAVNAVAVSYFPQIFLTPLAIVMNYVSLSMTTALVTTALLLQFLLLGFGFQETLEREASATNGEKQRTWFWFFIAFAAIAIIARALVVNIVAPSINIF